MRLPTSEHTSRPWRVHQLTADFRVEDVWALPTMGDAGDFPRLVTLMTSSPAWRGTSGPAQALWATRRAIGQALGWDGPETGLGSRVAPLRERLPADLRDGPRGPNLGRLFTSLYVSDDEWALEVANQTVHGVLHLGWVAEGSNGYRGQMAVLTKPNGTLGRAYIAAIAPLRHRIVYPAMLQAIGRAWQAREQVPSGV